MEKDMKLTSKFDKGQNVWFFNNMGGDNGVKFLEGTIAEVQSWDQWSGFRYNVTHIDANGASMNYNAEEKNMYKTKDEVLASIFEENGTVVEPVMPETTPSA